MKNPYNENSPEWQLFANMRSMQLSISAYTKDVERYQNYIFKCVKQFELYHEALEKLDPEFKYEL